ncbi:MAG TPA: hypothetical protein VGG09_08060 [Acidimicrobiales bacterium]
MVRAQLAAGMAAIAGLPTSGASVSVGPPLSAKAPSKGSVDPWLVESLGEPKQTPKGSE